MGRSWRKFLKRPRKDPEEKSGGSVDAPQKALESIEGQQPAGDVPADSAEAATESSVIAVDVGGATREVAASDEELELRRREEAAAVEAGEAVTEEPPAEEPGLGESGGWFNRL